MSRRNIYFRAGDNEVMTDLGNWTMIMVYAKQTDRDLYYVLKTETTGDPDTDEVTFDEDKLIAAVNFTTQLATALATEEELTEKFNGEAGLIDKVDSDVDDDFPFIYEDNNLLTDNASNIQLLQNLRDEILVPALEAGSPHTVFIM